MTPEERNLEIRKICKMAIKTNDWEIVRGMYKDFCKRDKRKLSDSVFYQNLKRLNKEGVLVEGATGILHILENKDKKVIQDDIDNFNIAKLLIANNLK